MQRPERLRRNPLLRNLSQETELATRHLVLPLFLNAGKSSRDITSMPGVRQWNVEESLPFVEKQLRAGLRSFILFGIVEGAEKDAHGSAAWAAEGPVPRALQLYRREFGQELSLWADTCFCEYTDHGHCGPMHTHGLRQHGETLGNLGKAAVAYAQAGADVIAPSGMVDGMVAAIRHTLDEQKLSDVAICSYAVKYASSFYGPFREAAENAPTFGDRRSYQMNPANRREALREAELDAQEGADLLMVKPGLPYLDIVREVADRFALPVGAYQVSGEYAMVKAAAEKGWIDEDKVFLESLLSLRRAGAQFILSYWAPRAAELLRER